MNAILVRVGVDQAYGQWNAPVDPESGCFVYVPIPEKQGTPFKAGLERSYQEIFPALRDFVTRSGIDPASELTVPPDLQNLSMHLDPDFDWLTYGDNGDVRGAEMKHLRNGDLLVFYAGLRSVRSKRKLVYALVGLYVVEEVVLARCVPAERHRENAHTRKREIGDPDIVVRGKPGESGRLEHCIPIGEWRNRAYRVTKRLLEEWGGLSVKDGFIQRSVRPPSFLDAPKFYRWFLRQEVGLMEKNN